MKKVSCALATGTLLLGLVCSCNNSTDPITPESLFKNNPVTINWTGDKTDSITSFATNVEVYSMNNRVSKSLALTSRYKLTLKQIDDLQYSKVDLKDSNSSDNLYSILTNGKETCFVNYKTFFRYH